MRPKTTRKDLPSRHEIEVYIHNAFVGWLNKLKSEIIASAKKTVSYMALVDHIFVHKVNIGLVQPYMPFYGLAQPYIPLYGQVQNHILVNKKCNVIYYV
jgi:hypothetical protein